METENKITKQEFNEMELPNFIKVNTLVILKRLEELKGGKIKGLR